MLPTARRIAALGHAVNPFSKPFLEQVLLAGKATSTEIAPVIMVRRQDEIDAAFTNEEPACGCRRRDGGVSYQELGGPRS